MDQHEVGAIAVARMLRDAGMDVVYLGRFNLPPGLVQAAVQEGADVIGLSCHSWEYLHYLDEILERLRDAGREIPVVIGGSVITPSDARAVVEKGVAAAFGPSARPEEFISTIEQLARRPEPTSRP
jgi:methylmalonyl-CoA mutase C-terminal domain/subunit